MRKISGLCIYWLIIISFVPAHLLETEAGSGETLGMPTIIPSVVPLGIQTEVTITIHISDPRLVPTTVMLHEVDSSNRVVAKLLDDGLGGDAVPGDGIFTGKHSLTFGKSGAAAAKLFRVSATFRTVPGQILSESVAVFAANDPDLVESIVAAYVDTLPGGIPSPNDASHPGVPAWPITDDIASSVASLTGSQELTVFGVGSLVLLGFAVPNFEAFNGALALMNVLDTATNTEIDTDGNPTNGITKISVGLLPGAFGQFIAPNEEKTLPEKAVDLAKLVVGAPYLGDGETWGGKGWDGTIFVDPDKIKHGYNFWNNKLRKMDPVQV